MLGDFDEILKILERIGFGAYHDRGSAGFCFMIKVSDLQELKVVGMMHN